MAQSALFQYKMSLEGELIPIQDEPEGLGMLEIEPQRARSRVREAEKLSLEAIGRIVEASEEIRFESENRQQVYGWVEQVLVEQPYARRGKAARGKVLRGAR